MEQISAVGGQLSEDKETLAETGFYWRERGPVKVLVCGPMEEAGFTNGFSTRLGGVSPFPENSLNLAGFDEDSAKNIRENRRRFLGVFHGSYRLATAWQVHGNTIKVISSERDVGNSEERADALVSDLDGVLVGVKTADCVPVLLGDTETGTYAAVHAGWRGTAQSIAAQAVDNMREFYGTDPADVVAVIGPAAGCERYEIGQEVIDVFSRNFPKSEKYLKSTRRGHALIDLPAANRDQLVKAGVSSNRIFISQYCTMDRADLFFSYRIEKNKYGRTGRLLSVIGKSQNHLR